MTQNPKEASPSNWSAAGTCILGGPDLVILKKLIFLCEISHQWGTAKFQHVVADGADEQLNSLLKGNA